MPAIKAAIRRVSKGAPIDSTVLITGEKETGKGLIARAIHKRSKCRNRAFIKLCFSGWKPYHTVAFNLPD